MERLLVVCLGGALGSGARYLLGGFVQNLAGPAFPAGTLAVNVLGSFLMGVAVQWSTATSLAPTVRLLLTSGVLGGFTTYSAFSYETLALLERGTPALALVNVAVTVTVCLASCWLGVVAARALAGS